MLATLPLVSFGIAIFSVGVAALFFLKSWRWTAAALVLCLVVPLALSGFLVSSDWGISDWDYYFTEHTIYRNTIVQFHQFPLWNPYTCGGTAALADPEFSVLTPTFLLELVFGVPIGVRVAIILSTIIGGMGMLMLIKRLKLPVEAGLVAAMGYMLGGVNLLEVVEGHVNIFAAMWIPWVLWAFLGSYRDKRRTLWCGIFLGLTFLQGGIYLLMYTGIIFIALCLLLKNRRRAFVVAAQSMAWSLGLAAFKIIPVFVWLRQFQDSAYGSSAYTLPYLYDILLGRYLHGAIVFPAQGAGWHEYGAYIGPIILLLAAAGIVLHFRERLIRVLFVGLIASILISSAGPLLKPFFDQASFLPRSEISRFILVSIIALCILAAFGISRLRLQTKTGKLIALFLLVALSVDLMTYANALSEQAFVVPPVTPLPTTATPPIEFDTRDLKTRVDGDDFSRSYALTLTGYGTMNYCSPLGPSPSVRTIYDEGDHSGITLANHAGSIASYEWTPNQVTVTGIATADTAVVLNTNYASGWRAEGKAAINSNDHPAAPVLKGPFHVTLTYAPPGLLLGLLVSALTLGLAAVISLRKKHAATL